VRLLVENPDAAAPLREQQEEGFRQLL